jgi:cytosolic carboxypeptidase protein 2/3
MFSFEDCCFAVQKSKETCGRVVMWKEFNLINSFTLEVSFMGPNKGHSAGYHFNTTQLKLIGRQFCETLADYTRDLDRVKEVF